MRGGYSFTHRPGEYRRRTACQSSRTEVRPFVCSPEEGNRMASDVQHPHEPNGAVHMKKLVSALAAFAFVAVALPTFAEEKAAAPAAPAAEPAVAPAVAPVAAPAKEEKKVETKKVEKKKAEKKVVEEKK